eukprot:6191874-Pleurochrysis_carterae.AAC.1
MQIKHAYCECAFELVALAGVVEDGPQLLARGITIVARIKLVQKLVYAMEVLGDDEHNLGLGVPAHIGKLGTICSAPISFQSVRALPCAPRPQTRSSHGVIHSFRMSNKSRSPALLIVCDRSRGGRCAK